MRTRLQSAGGSLPRPQRSSSTLSSRGIMNGNLLGEDVYDEEELDRRFPVELTLKSRWCGSASRWYGFKTIGFIYSICFMANVNISPWLLSLPPLFASSSWISAVIFSVCLVIVNIVAIINNAMLAEMARRVRGNEHFRGRTTYPLIVDAVYGPLAKHIFTAFYLLYLLTLMLILAGTGIRAVDDLLQRDSLWSMCGIPPWATSSAALPVSLAPLVISRGYIILGVFLIPMSMYAFAENMVAQTLAAFVWFTSLVGIIVSAATSSLPTFPAPAPSADFASSYFADGPPPMHHKYPASVLVGCNGVPIGWAHDLPLMVFGFSMVALLPAWCSEKKPAVSVNRSIVVGSIVPTAIVFLAATALATFMTDWKHSVTTVHVSPAVPSVNASMLSSGELLGLHPASPSIILPGLQHASLHSPSAVLSPPVPTFSTPMIPDLSEQPDSSLPSLTSMLDMYSSSMPQVRYELYVGDLLRIALRNVSPRLINIFIIGSVAAISPALCICSRYVLSDAGIHPLIGATISIAVSWLLLSVVTYSPGATAAMHLLFFVLSIPIIYTLPGALYAACMSGLPAESLYSSDVHLDAGVPPHEAFPRIGVYKFLRDDHRRKIRFAKFVSIASSFFAGFAVSLFIWHLSMDPRAFQWPGIRPGLLANDTIHW